jgi:hypothetical protein
VQIVHKTLSWKYPKQTDKNSAGGVVQVIECLPAQQAWGPDFKLQYHQKIKKKKQSLFTHYYSIYWVSIYQKAKLSEINNVSVFKEFTR